MVFCEQGFKGDYFGYKNKGTGSDVTNHGAYVFMLDNSLNCLKDLQKCISLPP